MVKERTQCACAELMPHVEHLHGSGQNSYINWWCGWGSTDFHIMLLCIFVTGKKLSYRTMHEWTPWINQRPSNISRRTLAICVSDGWKMTIFKEISSFGRTECRSSAIRLHHTYDNLSNVLWLCSGVSHRLSMSGNPPKEDTQEASWPGATSTGSSQHTWSSSAQGGEEDSPLSDILGWFYLVETHCKALGIKAATKYLRITEWWRVSNPSD